ncbi:MAG: N-acetylglucosamine kinase [Fulvivirga sp.]
MILIADSGSTKTDWRHIKSDGSIVQYKTEGLNPYYESEEKIATILKDSLGPQVSDEVDEIYFYGAGCSSDNNRNAIKNGLGKLFAKSQIEINHDLLGAARSLCGAEPGIVCILGTGSNSCMYNGVDIVDNVPSLGFILGDEGSGAWLGKRLLNEYFSKSMPADAQAKFETSFSLSREEVLSKVYQSHMPSRYLAAYSKFIFENINDPYFYGIVKEGFELFYRKTVMNYENFDKVTVHFTGSVAYHYANILRKVATDLNIHLKNIVESPIAGLTLFHQNSIRKNENN